MWSFSRSFQGPQQAALLDPLAQEKLVGPDNTFNHCGALPEKTWQIFVDTGANINVCPRSDAQYALGEGVCALQHAWDHGIKPGLSIDNETAYGGDMFTEMRVALYLQRAVAHHLRFSGDQNPPKPLMVRDVLYCATMGGAHCAGLDDKIGSLTPGKDADILMIRTDDINLYPSNNAVGTVVQAAERSNVMACPVDSGDGHNGFCRSPGGPEVGKSGTELPDSTGQATQRGHRHHRWPRSQASRQGARPRHEPPEGDGRGVARSPLYSRRLSPRHLRRTAAEVVVAEGRSDLIMLAAPLDAPETSPGWNSPLASTARPAPPRRDPGAVGHPGFGRLA
jgi:hypothetical protein